MGRYSLTIFVADTFSLALLCLFLFCAPVGCFHFVGAIINTTPDQNQKSILYTLWLTYPYESSEVFAFFTKNHSLKGIKTLFFFSCHILDAVTKVFKKDISISVWVKLAKDSRTKTGLDKCFRCLLSSPPVNISQNYETCSLKNSFWCLTCKLLLCPKSSRIPLGYKGKIPAQCSHTFLLVRSASEICLLSTGDCFIFTPWQ